MAKLQKKGASIQPVRIEGRQIALTFWGKAWCDHLEGFSDFENRLPRGRTYVRNGSVCHLDIRKGVVEAKVSGSEIYDVSVKIKTLPGPKWGQVKARCAGRVGSLLELLQGKLSDHVMSAVTDTKVGLFPGPREMRFTCSCPDWADMCKHVAAVLYGVGARLDQTPELLFRLRGVDHTELVGEDAAKAIVARKPKGGRRTLDEGSLADVFGIEVDKAGPGKRARSQGTAPPPPGPRTTPERDEKEDVASRLVRKKPLQPPMAAPRRRMLSAKARRIIAAAQKARWAAYRASIATRRNERRDQP
jgi:uncharacterized Zn finger protein